MPSVSYLVGGVELTSRIEGLAKQPCLSVKLVCNDVGALNSIISRLLLTVIDYIVVRALDLRV